MKIEKFRAALRKARGEKSLQDVQAEIGINSSTLSRIDRNQTPSIETFEVLCGWMKANPMRFLEVKQRKERDGEDRP